jgi:RNA polymerase sigma-70 factor (ECF subfamily)
VDDPDSLFDLFYEEFAPRLRGLVVRFRRVEDLAEDLIQEVLLRAYRAELYLDPGIDPWPWLSTVCRNLAIDKGRRRETHPERCIDIRTLGSLPAPAELVEDPEALLVSSSGDAAEALSHLDERNRRMLILKHVRGWRYDEIAEWEGITVASLRSSLTRARETFRHAYAAIVEGRAVPALFAPFAGSVARRVRAWRDRVTNSDVVTAFSHGAASVPSLANAVATAVVLGAIAVTGPAAGGVVEPLQSEARPVRWIMESMPQVGSSEPAVAEPRVQGANDTTVTETPGLHPTIAANDSPSAPTVSPVTAASPPEDRGEPAPAPALTSPVNVTIDESGASADGGGADAEVDTEPRHEEQHGGDAYYLEPVDVSSDPDGDGQANLATGNPYAKAYCPPPEERGAVTKAACPLMQGEDSLPAA